MWRINRALISNFAPILLLIGMRKDHKANLENNPVLGPKFWPLHPANNASNAPLGNLMASICRVLANEHHEKANTELISMEELMYNIQVTKIKERLNRVDPSWIRETRKSNLIIIQDMRSTVVISQDVSTLYPSMTKELSVRTVKTSYNGFKT